jgi:integrase
MARHRRPAPSGGRVFQRQSRHTGAPLATWWIAYYVDGKECRESAHSADLEVAQRLLRTRLHAVDEGTFVGPERERLTVNAILDALLDFYAVHGHRSVATAGPQVKAWRPPLGALRALAVTTGRILRLTREWQASGTSNATINRRLALLHRAYRLAKLHPDPARLDFMDCRLPECSPLGKHLSPEAFVALAEHLDVGRRAFFEFCYLTGKRKGQMSRTMWAPHYNAETAEFTWNATEVKAKRPEVLPLVGRPPRAHRGALRGAPAALPLCVSRAQLCGRRATLGSLRMRRRLQAALGHRVHEGRLPGRSQAWRLRLPQHAPHRGDQPRQRRRPGARGDGRLRAPNPQRV